MNRTMRIAITNYRRITSDGKETAKITCPKCGEEASLAEHDILPDGTVEPSCICPKDCGFHEFVRLDGWSTSTKAIALMNLVGSKKLLYFNERTGLLEWTPSAERELTQFFSGVRDG